MKDFHNHFKATRALSPVSVADNTAQVSEIIDRQGYEACEFVILTGAIADADVTFAVTMDHGEAANLSDAAAVATADLLGTLAGAGFQFDSDNQTRKIGYKGNKRYVRLTITPAANASAALLAAVAILTSPRKEPISSQS